MNVRAQGGEGLVRVESDDIERELLVTPNRQQIEVRENQDRLNGEP